MWSEVLERFEQHAPVGVMARVALEQALPATCIDEVFEASRQRQYPRELLMSTVVELMMLVSLGLRPSLHAAARKMEQLPVSLAALYDKVNRTEPAVLRALVQGSAARLAPVMAQLGGQASLSGWRLRILDGYHLPASQKRLAPLRDHRGAALPGHTLVVYDPDQALVTDIVACEDAHESERTVARTLVASAGAGELWLADSHFCTRALLQGWQQAGVAFIVREHGRHPRLVHQLVLDEPTREGLTQLNLWSNLPPQVIAEQIANLYRRRWRIEGLFGRIESVLHSEIRTLGHPRAALLGFATAVLAYNVLSLPKRSYVEAAAIRKHVSTARVLRSAKGETP